jgi:hypothetical protein
MSLFYYIIYRASHYSDWKYGDSKLLFIFIQFLWLVMVPMLLIKKLTEYKVIEIHFYSTERIIFGIIGLIAILFFDYIYYFKEINEKEILKNYTYKYKIIENYPIFMFLISYFSLLILGMFLMFLL